MNRYHTIEQLESIILKTGFKASRNYIIKNKYQLSGADIIKRVKEKHNSTLHLIRETEFQKGLSEIESFNTKGVNLSIHIHY